ncbi:hypothetical protein SmJEL517_g00576 [Synchytrium microbalum]|uniref:Cep57 centrosome microtubule-binding domain-containing protein n=1 Tax=Synchytrium microbalum TaxID=1806994 RepID=A0A507CIY8_9FUNG|nr:uncharacterized protein SmJEL517_g00576 [Synchytrium microbalum]TPX37663.1 hypothetical protein SmJEL517_g00576 [Synchytrium microbalum]
MAGLKLSPAKDNALEFDDLSIQVIPVRGERIFSNAVHNNGGQDDLEVELSRLERELSVDMLELSFVEKPSQLQQPQQHQHQQHRLKSFAGQPIPMPNTNASNNHNDESGFSFSFDVLGGGGNNNAGIENSQTGRRLSSASFRRESQPNAIQSSPIPIDETLRKRFDQLLNRELERTDSILQRSAGSISHDDYADVHTDLETDLHSSSSAYFTQPATQRPSVASKQHGITSVSPPTDASPRAQPPPNPSKPPTIPNPVDYNNTSSSNIRKPPVDVSAIYENLPVMSSASKIFDRSMSRIVDNSRPLSTVEPSILGEESSLGVGEKLHQDTSNFLDTQHRPIGNLPEDHSSRAVISALRTLQEKIAQLEKEKMAAKSRLAELERELNRNREDDGLPNRDSGARERESAKADILLEKIKLENMLASSKSQANLLERQLEYSRKMAQSAASERDEALQNLEHIRREVAILRATALRNAGAAVVSASTATSPTRPTQPSRRVEVSEHGDMPRHPSRRVFAESAGTAAATLATSADDLSFLQKEDVDLLRTEIDEARSRMSSVVSVDDEEKLKQILLEKALRRSRKVAADPSKKRKKPKTEDLPTRPALPKSTVSNAAERQVPTWRKVESRPAATSAKSVVNPIVQKQRPSVEEATSHDEAVVGAAASKKSSRDLPFISGTSVTKSYSVTANLQKVYSMLKNHNPQLCSVCRQKRRHAESPPKPRGRNETGRTYEPIETIERENDLVKVLSLLEDEFLHLKIVYQDLVARYEDAAESTGRPHLSASANSNESNRMLRSLGDELRDIIQSMEIKGDQISILREIVSATTLARSMQSEAADDARVAHHLHHPHVEHDRSRSRRRDDKIPFPRMRSKSQPPVEGGDAAERRIRSRSVDKGSHLANLGLLKSSMKVQSSLA